MSKFQHVSYDPQGNLWEKIDRDGRRTTCAYNTLDRVEYEVWYTGASHVHTVNYGYDKLGRVILNLDFDKLADSARSQSFVYDDLGRLKQNKQYFPAPLGATSAHVEQTYTYDVLHAADSQHYVRTIHTQRNVPTIGAPTTIGTTTTFTDRQGRVARIEDTPSGQSTKRVEYTYDDADQLIDVARTSGSFFFDTRYDYDNAGRVTEIEHLRDDDVTPFSVYAFEYDLADRITYQTTTYATGITAVDGTRTEDYTFDDAGQLTGNNSSVNAQDEAYTYDANGNRIGGDLDTGPYNRLEEDADWEYTYDKEGNLVRKDAKVGSAYTEYTYDHRNRLVTVKRYDPAFSNGVNNITYRYNAGDQLVERYDRYLHGGSAPTFDARQYYVHNGSQRVLEFAEDGDLAHRATWGPGIDRLLGEDLYGANGQLLDSIWAATDHLGSVNHLLANNESIIEHRRYDSFGDIEAVFNELGQNVVLHQNTWDQTSLISDYAFAGRTWDLSADLYFNERRFYDPATGRFINEDPAHDGSNWYAYAGNDPINNYDPTGLSIAKPTDNLYGGYGGGKISKAPPPVYVSPTVNYNPVAAPTYSATQLFGGTPTISNNGGYSKGTGSALGNNALGATAAAMMADIIHASPLDTISPYRNSPIGRAVPNSVFMDMLVPGSVLPRVGERDIQGRGEVVSIQTVGSGQGLGTMLYGDGPIAQPDGYQSPINRGDELVRGMLNTAVPPVQQSHIITYTNGSTEYRYNGLPSGGDMWGQGMLGGGVLTSGPKVSAARPNNIRVEQGRDALGRFLPKNPGELRPGSLAEQETFDAIRQKPGWTVIDRPVAARDATGQLRVYDGVAVSPNGKYIGLETKSGTATRTSAQSAFDSRLNSNKGNTAQGVGRSSEIVIERSIEVRR